jgi:hypothetical protein
MVPAAILHATVAAAAAAAAAAVNTHPHASGSHVSTTCSSSSRRHRGSTTTSCCQHHHLGLLQLLLLPLIVPNGLQDMLQRDNCARGVVPDLWSCCCHPVRPCPTMLLLLLVASTWHQAVPMYRSIQCSTQRYK